MTTQSATDIINGNVINADTAEPYVAQLARQLQAFSSITDVDDLAPDDVADLLLVMANAAERLETEASHIALLAQRKGVGKHLGSSSTGAWLAHRTRSTPGHVHRMIRRSETEHAFGLFYLAHADGNITVCPSGTPSCSLALSTSRRRELHPASCGAMFRSAARKLG